ncbi:MAG: glycosyltransferase [Candidatus Jordarchaeales archaeon]
MSEKQAGRTLILTAGRLSPEKGLRFLLLTLKKVANIHPQVLCLIAGDGPSHSYLVREVQRLGLGDYVKLLGHRPDLPAIMRLVDWFVLPSLREGLPLVLLEAFALSKPVIATAVGGVPEVVVDGVNGWLVPPRDTTALAEALSRALYLSEQERCEMGEAGRAIVEERFTPEAQIPKIGRLYQKLLAEHSSCG